MNSETDALKALRFDNGQPRAVEETLAVEGPLQIKINGHAWTSTMRTPGHDRELTAGLLFTEGLVEDLTPEISMRQADKPPQCSFDCMEVTLPDALLVRPFLDRRSLMSTSSCGLCGKRDPEDYEMSGRALRVPKDERLDATQVPRMMDAMRDAQPLFSRTGGCHSAAVFTHDSALLGTREDVGRHNAVDKVVGQLLLKRRLHAGRILAISGRISYEILMKAYRANLPFIIAVSAPSSLAVRMAERFGMTLVGFCRGDRATAYSHFDNVVAAASAPAAVRSQPPAEPSIP